MISRRVIVAGLIESDRTRMRGNETSISFITSGNDGPTVNLRIIQAVGTNREVIHSTNVECRLPR